MKFKLKGTVKFSKNVEEVEKDIAKFIENANEEVLLKGLGNSSESEASKITEWKIKNDKLKVTINSGHKIRAHDGLLRLKKPLSELLGKKYNIK